MVTDSSDHGVMTVPPAKAPLECFSCFSLALYAIQRNEACGSLPALVFDWFRQVLATALASIRGRTTSERLLPLQSGFVYGGPRGVRPVWAGSWLFTAAATATPTDTARQAVVPAARSLTCGYSAVATCRSSEG